MNFRNRWRKIFNLDRIQFARPIKILQRTGTSVTQDSIDDSEFDSLADPLLYERGKEEFKFGVLGSIGLLAVALLLALGEITFDGSSLVYLSVICSLIAHVMFLESVALPPRHLRFSYWRVWALVSLNITLILSAVALWVDRGQVWHVAAWVATYFLLIVGYSYIAARTIFARSHEQ